MAISRLSTMCDVKKPLSKKKTSALREQFALFDKDGDGTISISELGSVLNSVLECELEPHELQRLIDIADTDRSGVVEFEEFTRLMYGDTGTLFDMDEEELTEAARKRTEEERVSKPAGQPQEVRGIVVGQTTPGGVARPPSHQSIAIYSDTAIFVWGRRRYILPGY